MTIDQAERFYKNDDKKYSISKNKELLIWLKKSINNGYNLFFSIDDLQKLVDNLTNWYEIKYPERELEYYEGTRYREFKDIKSLSNIMNLEQLFYRLPHKQLCLMKCNYRSNGGGIRDIFNKNGQIIGAKKVLFMPIERKEIKSSGFSYGNQLPQFLLYADIDSGEVNIDYNIKKYVDKEEITLDGLLDVFNEKWKNELDFTKLNICVYNHNCDIELRNRILQLVALKLLYSKETIPERGYERAKRFINEFNKKLGFNLNSNEIDRIVKKDYTKEEKKEKYILKDFADDDGEISSYWTCKSTNNKEKIIEKIKKHCINIKK